MTGDRESQVAKSYGKNWPLYEPIEHVHFFSGRSLSHLIKEHGFQIIHCEWRGVNYPKDSKLTNIINSARSLLGLIQTRKQDRLYVYMKKSGSSE